MARGFSTHTRALRGAVVFPTCHFAILSQSSRPDCTGLRAQLIIRCWPRELSPQAHTKVGNRLPPGPLTMSPDVLHTMSMPDLRIMLISLVLMLGLLEMVFAMAVSVSDASVG
ncbi:hypothetical protein A0H81_06260 [Grifola frondosa]|uniref:Uncharacterized protein n=1 Tax=Grifola frondosa TaxID=5627 RepID=A0A1C7MBT9_GRIFR|nr:hypothetical protein A0H81_06260 [Grifola frondosa]